MDAGIEEFVARVTPATRRRDAQTLLRLYGRCTGQPPRLRGTIIGFGEYHYRYESGREGTSVAGGFAPRKPATVIYLSDGVDAHRELLDRLGSHTCGVGCLYIKDLERVDLDILEQIISRSYRTLTGGTFPNRAREGGR